MTKELGPITEAPIYYVKTSSDDHMQVVNGSQCSEIECREFGCCFPDCATLDDKVYSNVEEMQKDYPNRKLEKV